MKSRGLNPSLIVVPFRPAKSLVPDAIHHPSLHHSPDIKRGVMLPPLQRCRPP
ncbi:hypothetical protein RHGRI_021719 [Rhododendron griersonianum]|uniref:Uncharacterized protein n=1 Tax=Rhododendron griersonianum TaxID=479676 RepID=A0AAV6JLI4_9ERIC|nr:hypothetical protein RHGRI_021719 [Rhododendron griersonianum]